MLGNRYSQHSFSQIPAVHMQRSQFDRSFAIKDTFDFDYLVPIFVDEILPGDTARVDVQAFGRLATQKVPIMDNMYMDFFFFFVPCRLVWDNWEKFNGAQDSPGDTTDYVIPTVTTDLGTITGGIFDKMGIPCVPDLEVNALPLRAYNLIWNEWFRDQNLDIPMLVNKDNGPDGTAEYVLNLRNKAHDYFTSALPWPQKGDAVSLPLGTTAPVISNNTVPVFTGFTTASGNNLLQIDAVDDKLLVSGYGGAAQFMKFAPNQNTGLVTDLTSATAATINALRQAMQIQSLLELDARGGTRYVEILQSHFGVVSPDFRLQRPEYLGGGRSYINVHPIPQTSPTAGSNPQGQLASYATTSATGSQIGFTKSFVEHGYVIGLVNARADITYQAGLNRMWSRQTRYDFFWPKLQQLGEQAILNKEIWATGTNPTQDNDIFGYQERYAEYRYKPSEIHGQFNSNFGTGPIDQWHLAQEFTALPELNEDFIKSTTPVDRAIAVPTEPHILLDVFFRYKHARPMMAYSVPATFGRF